MLNPTAAAPAASTDGWDKQEPPRLDVYVSEKCPNCGEAVRPAQQSAARYPDIVVRVIDLDELTGPPPDPVVAVPTCVLNGQVVSLGNPYAEELFARLREATA